MIFQNWLLFTYFFILDQRLLLLFDKGKDNFKFFILTLDGLLFLLLVLVVLLVIIDSLVLAAPAAENTDVFLFRGVAELVVFCYCNKHCFDEAFTRYFSCYFYFSKDAMTSNKSLMSSVVCS